MPVVVASLACNKNGIPLVSIGQQHQCREQPVTTSTSIFTAARLFV